MELTVMQPVKIEASAIRCVLPVRYDEDDMPNDFPHRKGDAWDITIDIETGQIRDWPAGVSRDLYMKVVDEGCYYLLDKDGKQFGAIEQDYAPRCIPEQYGDYVKFKISDSGIIADWKQYCTSRSVQEIFFPCDDE